MKTLAVVAALLLVACSKPVVVPEPVVVPMPAQVDAGAPPDAGVPVYTSTFIPVVAQAPVLEPVRLFFAFNSSDLTAEESVRLVALVAALKADPKLSVIVEGHCDERGSDAYNLALGHRRSDVVKAFLLINGAHASQVSAVSFGKSRPLDPGHDEIAWAKNRRVDVTF